MPGQVDHGKLAIGSQVELGFLEQTAVSGSERTVWEEARSRMTALIEAEADIDAASKAAAAGGPPPAVQLFCSRDSPDWISTILVQSTCIFGNIALSKQSRLIWMP